MDKKVARTGSVEPCRRADGSIYYRGRIRLADGSKQRVKLDEPWASDEAMAREFAAELQADEDETNELLKAKLARGGPSVGGETASEWFERYLPTRECGESHRQITGYHWARWIAPIIGDKAMRSLTRNDIEDVRDALDDALDKGSLRPASARNVWGTLTGALKAACAARDRSLRVLAAPIHLGILPPKRGSARQRTWLYPNEWKALVTSEGVPLDAKRLYAVALYSGLRPGELKALRWSDVDIKAKVISVSKAFDVATGEAKPPKTESGQRTIPIHENLLPLLTALRGKPGDLVVDSLAPLNNRVVTRFREHLAAAKITRPRLTADNATEEPIDFRSLRDSCATWLALASVPEKVIQRRMGHKNSVTTDGYIKAAESFGVSAIGAPFPPLPRNLWPTRGPRTLKTGENSVGGLGFEGSENAEVTQYHDDSGRVHLTQVGVNSSEPTPVGPPGPVQNADSFNLAAELLETLRWARESNDRALALATLGELRALREMRERDELLAGVVKEGA